MIGEIGVIRNIGVFILGLCIGSFLNVLIYRLPRSLTLGGRSFCPKCKKQISWYDNVPLLSYLLLRGKCRNCRASISFRYPLVELLTGFLFLEGLERLGGLGGLGTLGILVIISVMIAIFFIDLEHQIIPDALVSLGVLGAVGVLGVNLITNIPSAIGAGLFFLLLHLITKGKGMGLGDVKLVFLMGLVLGFPGIIGALYFAFLTGAFVGVILILSGKKKFGQHIAFGPFLVAGFLVFLFFGQIINKWIETKF